MVLTSLWMLRSLLFSLTDLWRGRGAETPVRRYTRLDGCVFACLMSANVVHVCEHQLHFLLSETAAAQDLTCNASEPGFWNCLVHLAHVLLSLLVGGFDGREKVVFLFPKYLVALPEPPVEQPWAVGLVITLYCMCLQYCI